MSLFNAGLTNTHNNSQCRFSGRFSLSARLMVQFQRLPGTASTRKIPLQQIIYCRCLLQTIDDVYLDPRLSLFAILRMDYADGGE